MELTEPQRCTSAAQVSSVTAMKLLLCAGRREHPSTGAFHTTSHAQDTPAPLSDSCELLTEQLCLCAAHCRHPVQSTEAAPANTDFPHVLISLSEPSWAHQLCHWDTLTMDLGCLQVPV